MTDEERAKKLQRKIREPISGLPEEMEKAEFEEILEALKQAREEGRRDGEISMNEKAAKEAEHKYSSRVPQEAVGNLIAKRIRALLEEGKA